MSLLLGVPATADVVAGEPSVVAVIEDAGALLETRPGLPLALARLLAARLQVMTTYLVDLKQQYADHEGGLGMVDVVLGSLMQGSGDAQRARLGARSRPRVLDRLARATAARRRPRDDDHRATPVSVSISMRVGIGPALAAGVQHQRRADPVDPRAVGRERRLVHVPAQHDVGLVRSIHATSSSSP